MEVLMIPTDHGSVFIRTCHRCHIGCSLPI
nr:MAG TPA: cytochrome C6 [Caudoviricetes sp.]DAU82238.1 MAG TPA: cytochrome C6 [Caudoviricetes sp.]